MADERRSPTDRVGVFVGHAEGLRKSLGSCVQPLAQQGDGQIDIPSRAPSGVRDRTEIRAHCRAGRPALGRSVMWLVSPGGGPVDERITVRQTRPRKLILCGASPFVYGVSANGAATARHRVMNGAGPPRRTERQGPANSYFAGPHQLQPALRLQRGRHAGCLTGQPDVATGQSVIRDALTSRSRGDGRVGTFGPARGPAGRVVSFRRVDHRQIASGAVSSPEAPLSDVCANSGRGASRCAPLGDGHREGIDLT